jgi:ParB family chromosome partitioning protein
MEKTTKTRTAIGKFLEQIPDGFDQQITFNTKREKVEGKDTFGESLIFELPSGKKVKFIPKLIDPQKCKIWKGNVRLQNFLNKENTTDLQEKIKAQGQLIPVLARPTKEGIYTHEIIYGSRRHYVCHLLGINIKILEADLNDQDALAFMDAENAGRENLTAYEMAIAYKHWIDNGIFKSQGELSERLGITRSWLNKILSLARIPQEIVSTLGGPNGFTLTEGLELVRKLSNDPTLIQSYIEKANRLSQLQLDAAKILKSLLTNEEPSVNSKVSGNEATLKIIYSGRGLPMCKITNSNQGKMVLTFNSKFPKEKMPHLLKEMEILIKNSINNN